MYVIHKMQISPCYRKRHGHEIERTEARETPRVGHSSATRNPRTVPRIGPHYLSAETWRARFEQALPPARQLPLPGADRSRKNRNCGRFHESSVWIQQALSLRHVGVSESGSAWLVAR